MAKASLGELELTLSGDDSKLEAAKRRATKSMNDLEANTLSVASTISRSFALASAAAGAAVVAIAYAADKAAKSMSEMTKSAQGLGFTTEQFSRLSFAADTSGASAEALDGSIKELTRRLSNVDPMSETTRALQAMGLAFEHSSTKGMGVEKTMMAIADRFSKFKDGANKTALAVALFGEQGIKLIPFLNKGSSGINELMSEADRLGVTLGKDASDASIKYTENMAKLNSIVKAAGNAMTRELLPAMNETTGAMVQAAKDFDIVNKSASATRATIEFMSDLWVILKATASAAGAALSRIFEGIGEAATLNFTKAREAFSKVAEDASAAANSFNHQISDNRKITESLRGTQHAVESLGKAREKSDAPAIASAYEINKALEERRMLYQSMLQDATNDNTTTTTDKIARLNEMVRAGQITWREYISTVRGLNESETQQALQNLTSNETLPISDKVAELNSLLERGAINLQTYGNTLKDVNRQGERSMDDLLSTTSNALTSIFENNKAAAIASAIINTYQGVTKALAQYPPPISFAMAGLQAAMGFAQVAKIRSTSKSSSSSSASSSVPSSSAQTAATSSQPSAGNQQTLFLQGIDPRQMFSGDVVRDLAKKLVDFQRDGGRVILGGT